MHRDLVSVAHTVVVCLLLASRLIIKDKENANVQLLQQTHSNSRRAMQWEEIFTIKIVANIQLFHSWISLDAWTQIRKWFFFTFSTFLLPFASSLPPPIIIIIIYCIYKDGVELITIYDFLWISQDSRVKTKKFHESWDKTRWISNEIHSFSYFCSISNILFLITFQESPSMWIVILNEAWSQFLELTTKI